MSTKAWKEDRTIKGVSGYDSPIPPSVQEQAEDEEYGNDFAVLVVMLKERLRQEVLDLGAYGGKTDVNTRTRIASHRIIRSAADVMMNGALLSTDHYLADFHEKWGTPKALRALATALEQGA